MSDISPPPLEPVHRIEGSSSIGMAVDSGGFFQLILREPLSSGYAWRVDHVPDFLRVVGLPHPPSTPPSTQPTIEPIGGAGQRALRFLALEPGSGTLSLTLRRPWMPESDPPAESVAVHVECRAPGLAAQPSGADFLAAVETTPYMMLRMARLAANGQWALYAEAASQAGSWLPIEAADPQDFMGRGLWDPIRAAAVDYSLSLGDLLASARAGLGAGDAQLIAQALLEREIVDPTLVAAGVGFIASLIHAGADPLGASPGDSCPAALAVERAEATCLRALLDAGLDPNAQAPMAGGPMPLILLALMKDRMVSMSEKMACAKALFDAGASLPNAFSGCAGPTSMLETMLAAEGLFDPSLGEAPGYGRHYPFSFNYFDESGIPPSELLPAPEDEAGRARILRLLAEPEDENELGDPRAPVRGPVWRLRAQTHPWLGAALDLLELDASSRPGSPRGSARSL